MFVGKQLSNIRQMNELSRAELAQKLNITEQAVWQYENAYTSPKLEVILKLTELFDVKSKYFYQQSEIYNVVNEKTIPYRSLKKNSMQRVIAEKLFLEQIESLLVYIENTVEFPPNQLMSLRKNVLKFRSEHEIEDDYQKEQIIETIAEKSRVFLGLDSNSNDNLLFLLEKNGAFVLEKPMEVETDGYSTWTIYDRPYIILNSNRKTGVRRNFDLAHELGHILMHYNEDFQSLDKSSYNILEKEADFFASSFLLPKDAFLKDLEFVSKLSNPKSYIELKKKWNVSIAAMGRRAYSLNKMTYQQYRHFNALLRRYEYVKSEPLDIEIEVTKPGKVRSLVKHVLDKKAISINDLIVDFNLNLSKIVSLFNFENNFFEKYLQTEKDYHFAEVRHLKIK